MQTEMATIGVIPLIFLSVFALAFMALYVVIFWQILKKAGYNPALSLLLIVPIINGIAALVIIIMLAFGKWPVYEKLSQGTLE